MTDFRVESQGSGSGAPSDATYITQTANGSLSAEQALSSLATGIMRVATTTGVITSLTDSAGIAANISDETGSGSLVFATSPSLTTPTLNGATLLAENASLQLDSALSADGTYCGIIEAGTAGATLAFGDLCYLAAADSRWELTDASAIATSGDVKIGICVLAAASDGDPTTILLWGKVRADTAFPAFTISAPVHISETAGDVVVAAPTTTDSVTRRVGFANTADELFFCPSPDYYTHT